MDFNLTGAGFNQTSQNHQIPNPRGGQLRKTTTASFGVRSSSARGFPVPPSLPFTPSSNQLQMSGTAQRFNENTKNPTRGQIQRGRSQATRKTIAEIR